MSGNTRTDPDRFTIKGIETDPETGKRYYSQHGNLYRNTSRDGQVYYRIDLRSIPLNWSNTKLFAFLPTSADDVGDD